MSSAKKIQDQFVSALKTLSPAFPISQQVIGAFYAVPRHHFIKKYRLPDKSEWVEVNDQNLEENLSYLYTNDPIIIHGSAEDFVNPEGKPIATISQLDLVLFMLELLKLEKGQKVFELGTASGFNAALMGHLVGPTAIRLTPLTTGPFLLRVPPTCPESFLKMSKREAG